MNPDFLDELEENAREIHKFIEDLFRDKYYLSNEIWIDFGWGFYNDLKEALRSKQQ